MGYKKARKRLQNRESAVRSRVKRVDDGETMQAKIQELMDQKIAIEAANVELTR